MAKSFAAIMKDYQERYDLDSLANPNDKANLTMLINNQLIIETIQDEIQTIIESGDIASNALAIGKLQSTLQSMIELSLSIERALSIDRKSRKKEGAEDVGSYLLTIKQAAREWLESQLIYVYCSSCKIMCGRILPAHEHTNFNVKFQCSQCGKLATAQRKERDIFFDLKEDVTWRKEHPVIIEQPKARNGDELIIEDEE